MGNIKTKKPIRSYSGIKWTTNTTNKKYLAIDFHNRCAYCDDLDQYGGGYNTYHVEHFAPQEKFDELKYTYDNLLYSCSYCNISKSNKWVGQTQYECIVDNKGFVDPCTDEYYNHLSREGNGNIIFLTPLGEYIYFELKLYLKRHSIIYNIDQLRMRRTSLKEKISKLSHEGKDVTLLREICNSLSDILCDYFEVFLDNNEC